MAKKKKHLPKEVLESKQMRFDRLQKGLEKAIKDVNPDAEKLAEQLVESYISLGKSIANHFVPKIKEKDKEIKKLRKRK